MQNFLFDGIEVSANLPAQVTHSSEKEKNMTRHTFCIEWKAQDAVNTQKPLMTLSWQKDMVDIQYQWHSGCGFNRTIRPDWGRTVASKISSGCPLHCFYNDAGMNRYTVALDDCVTLIERKFGIREENAALLMRVMIPLDGTGKSERYEVTLWIDETDCRYEEALSRVAAWWEKKYPPMPVPAAAKKPLYSCWYSFHQQVFAHEVEEECARAAQMGMKTVIVDDGWQTDDNSRGYAYCGDWQVTPGKIPDMRAHVAKVHELGMKYMLWYSVPFLGQYAQAAGLFKDKTLEYQPHHGAYTLDPRYPEVRRYLIDIYVRALKEWDLDGFKLDFIDSFRMTENTPAWREGMDYVVLEDAVHRLMVDVMQALRSIKPDILIEFRQSYTGPVMREFGNMFRVGDCPGATSLNRIGAVDLRLLAGNSAVHSDMLVWHENDRVENAVCQILNGIFSTVQISVRLDRVPENHVKAIRYWVDFMAREQALLQDAPIHAESPQNLYPLVWTEQDGRGIFACYEKNYVLDLPASRLNEAYLINANSGKELLVRTDECAEWKMTVRNCLGEAVCEETRKLCGLTALNVPECGMVTLEKV